jgi:hypothetical protein
LLALLNVPAAQSVQLRSVMALGAAVSWLPATHARWSMQMLRPASGWNVFSPQT